MKKGKLYIYNQNLVKCIKKDVDGCKFEYVAGHMRGYRFFLGNGAEGIHFYVRGATNPEIAKILLMEGAND